MMFPECTAFLGPVVELERQPIYEPGAGEPLDKACKRLCSRALIEERMWVMEFNGTIVRADPGDTPQTVYARWHANRSEL